MMENQCVKSKMDQKTIKIRAAIAFVVTFVLVMGCFWLLNDMQVKEEKLKATYTAESTISRVESQLNKYLAESALIKRTIESGYDISHEQFLSLAELMEDEDDVIEARELAQDGIVSEIYPLEGNKEAMGLNMLENPDRKKEARLAKESGEYTIAGPYELVQGGTGALLFEPAYVTDENGEKQFWGFSILVINWEKFIDEVDLDKLEDAGYSYQIWKKDLYTGEKIVIDQSSDPVLKSSMEVACTVPNDTWYFEIVPVDGWVTIPQIAFGLAMAVVLGALMSAGCWQFEMRRYRDAIHEAELEESAREAREANEAKTRFLFNMSHDIRTPMNAIIGFSDLLEKHLDEKEKVLDYLSKIKSSSSFLLSLINHVLEMARIESGKATLKPGIGSTTEFIESLNAVFEPAIGEKGLTYSYHVNVEHPYVICDETKVREIFLNVLGNSIKYTPKGGHVSLEITESHFSQKKKSAYRIVVEDTGIGMSKEYLPHIFEEFTREHTSTESKVVGTGLGLPIVKALVDLMDGKITVESEVGKGTKTTILLTFPIVSEEQIREMQEEEKQEQEESTDSLEGKRILLAEDNDLNAEIAQMLLKESGLQVDRVCDGGECIEKLRQMPENYYDAILMDIQMPHMDGYQATQKIRNLENGRAAVPIIAMTANAFDEDKQKAYAAGMNGYIAKPIDIRKMFAELRRNFIK